jgi:hypothetical protein
MAIYLKNVKFPVFPLTNNNIFYNEKNKLICEMESGEKKIVDDKSLEGDSLGLRRLKIPKESLYNLRRACFDIGNFLLYTKLYRNFVDSNGILFSYKKSTFVPLYYRKILKYVPYKGGTMLLIERLHCPIWYYRAIDLDKPYAALLYINRGFVILGLTDTPSERTKFKV